MLIYRLETANGLGIYDEGLFWRSGLSTIHDRHPDPYSDVPGWEKIAEHNWTGDWFFGFNSLWQLRRWFRKFERDALSKLGAIVCVYACEDKDVICGGKQVVFVREKATYSGALSVSSLEPIEE